MEMQLLIGAGLLLASIVFSKASSRFDIPSLIVFLLVGIAAGPEGFGHIAFDQPDATTLIATVALIFILFSGGLETSWNDLRPVLGRGILLATVGLIVNAVLVAAVLRLLLPLTWLESLL